MTTKKNQYSNDINPILKKRLNITLIALVFLVSIISGFLFIYYQQNFKRYMHIEARSTLENVSSQNALAIEKQLTERQHVLELLASSLGETYNFKIPDMLEKLSYYKDSYNFYNMGIINKNGICYTTLGEQLDLSSYDYFTNGMKGIASITKSYLSEDQSVFLNIFTYPIYKGNNVELLLTATYDSNLLAQLLEMPSFNGKGRSIIIDKDSSLVIQSDGLSNNDILFQYSNYKELFESDANQLKSNFIECTLNDIEYLVYYEPLNINNWYIVSFIEKAYVYENSKIIANNMTFAVLLIFSILLLFAGILIISYNKYQVKLSQIIFIDSLTQEKNLECLKLDFKRMSRSERKNKSLIIIDIEKFKTINLLYGSQVGDTLLKYIFRAFKSELPSDTLYKDNADIFVGIISHKTKKELIEKLEKLHNRLERDIDEHVIVPITISIGVCSIDNSDDLHHIYSNALIAKNHIKGNFNKHFCFYDESFSTQIIENTQIESRFPTALQNHEFEVWYQPKFNMKNNSIFGAEALVRWRNPDGSLLSPAKFIPVFEQNGQIIQLDKEIIEIVCKDLNELKNQGCPIVPVSINLSRLHLNHYGVIDTIKTLTKKYNIDPTNLTFEITESALIDDHVSINNIITELHNMGFGVDMDDYGTGTSTLSSLSSSNFDTLKLDQSFISKIGNQKMDIIVKSTISMVTQLNMNVIAEGIEEKAQVEFLIKNNCYIGQGYYFSKPLHKNDYIRLLNAQQ